MLPPFLCCGAGEGDPHPPPRHHQERKLRMLTYWRDGIERQLAAVNAAISTLEQQMTRTAGSSPD
jgi:hypothetical protein